MNDWHNFFNRVDDNLATSTYRLFDKQSKTEIFDWFSREDVEKEQKEDFIQALVEFKDDCGDFYHYRAYLLAAEALNYFKNCSRGDAIAALTKFIDSTEDNYLLLDAAHILGKIDLGNQKALSTLIEFIQTVGELDNTEIYEPEYEQSCRNFQQLDAADKLQEILLINQMPPVVVALKDYLSKSNWDSSYRYEACYRLIGHCAQNMTYPDFLDAWHKSP